MRKVSAALIAVFALGLLAGCSSGEVSAKDMQDSQKQIDADNAKLNAKNPDAQ